MSEAPKHISEVTCYVMLISIYIKAQQLPKKGFPVPAEEGQERASRITD